LFRKKFRFRTDHLSKRINHTTNSHEIKIYISPVRLRLCSDSTHRSSSRGIKLDRMRHFGRYFVHLCSHNPPKIKRSVRRVHSKMFVETNIFICRRRPIPLYFMPAIFVDNTRYRLIEILLHSNRNKYQPLRRQIHHYNRLLTVFTSPSWARN
jgi:hypothetical protein